jgi:hypothetical protein
MDHVQVVQDGNDDVIVRDDIFQLNELIDPYWVAPSTELEKNSNFRVTKNIFLDVDTEEFNDILRMSGHTKVNKDDEIDEL